MRISISRRTSLVGMVTTLLMIAVARLRARCPRRSKDELKMLEDRWDRLAGVLA